MADQAQSPEFEKLRKEMEQWPTEVLEAAEVSMEQALLYLHGKLPEYPDPPLPNPDGVSYLNDAQRRWFFANARKGNVKGWQWIDGHPQKTGSARTGNLGRKFTEDVERDGTAVLGSLGTDVDYAPWVVGPAYPGEIINGKTMYQARIHVDRWWQFEPTMTENMDGAWETFTETFWPEFLAKIGTQP
jgi:hypothetical protein